MITQNTRCLLFVLPVAFIFFTPTGLLAQTAGGDTDGCSPSCRIGFSCLNGRCVSPCNPPCAASEVCLRSGVCVPEYQAAVTRKTTTYPAQSGRQLYYEEQQYKNPHSASDYKNIASQRKTGGGFLLVLGLVGIVTANVMSIVEPDETVIWISLGVAAASQILMIIGIALISSANARRAKRRKGLAFNDNHPPIVLEGVGPMILGSGEKKGHGFGLSLAF